MSDHTWMIYGAYGYTGRLVALEALRRGHRPLLAGRSAEKLAPLAEHLGLDWLSVDLQDQAALRNAVSRVELVYHAAGPFIRTSAPMLEACLAAHVNYVDITGEIPVLQNTFAHDEAARRSGIVLISGAGFDVVPSDCLAKYVAGQLPGAISLDIAMTYATRPSTGTARSLVEMLPAGGLVRRAGRLLPWTLGAGATRVHFPVGDRTVVPVPLADLETAYCSTGIPNITTYLALPSLAVPLVPVFGPLAGRLLSMGAVKAGADWLIARAARGPDLATRARARAYLWARARRAAGSVAEHSFAEDWFAEARFAEAWLVTPEPYQFTALAAARIAERILEERPTGALTPAQALGAGFVLEIPGVFRK
jgi:short subunit dehydrogenase-like uncharacterized protein